jgi:iron complex transport system ATP-binding protein
MSDPILEVESLCWSCRDRSVLRDVSFSIHEGEHWTIVGRNGVGKSSLIKCLIRIVTGWQGRVRLYGAPLESFSQRDLARKIAYVPQSGTGEFFPFTVREFVRMARYPHTSPWARSHPTDVSAIEEAMARTGTEEFANRMINTLSGGEQQKVYIAAALAQEAPILLLDEPTAFLDYRHQEEVLNLLRQINRKSGTTLLMVTHDLNVMARVGGNVLALQDGTGVYAGPVSGLLSAERLESVFDVPFRFVEDLASGRRILVPEGESA